MSSSDRCDDGSLTEKSASTMDPSTEKSPSMEEPTTSPSQRTMAVVALTGISFLNTMGSGMLTVALPQIAKDVGLADNILLWPASVYALAAGCTLLIFGSVADVAGDKPVWITGSILYTFFTLGCGLSKSAAQLIAFRTLLGISIAMCLPSAVSLMTRTFGPGKMRNIGFAAMGMGQPLGYSVGLILGGVFADSIGWRYGFYISAILNAILSVLAFWCLPPLVLKSPKSILKGCLEIDWVGAIMISVSLGLISFVLAQLTNNYNSIGDAYIIVLLVVSIVLLPVFGVWAGWRERKNRPALIPNSLWKNSTFTSTCIIVFFTWAVFNAFQYFSSLYFQNVQHHSALASSIRFIPMVVVGAATNIFTGFVVDKIQVRTLVFVSAIICLVPPLLMALVKPEWGYWQGPFVAMLLSPLHPDVLFTVSNLIISQAYPGKNQSLAGAVFNSVSQVGNSVGLAVSAVIAASVTDHAASHDLEKGYQAAFWMMFAAMIVVCIVSLFGLRSGGKVGKKSE